MYRKQIYIIFYFPRMYLIRLESQSITMYGRYVEIMHTCRCLIKLIVPIYSYSYIVM